MMSQHSSTSPATSADLVCPLLVSDFLSVNEHQGRNELFLTHLFGLLLFHRKS